MCVCHASSMNATATSNQTVHQTVHQTALSGGNDWDTWELTIGADEAVFMGMGFALGSLVTAVLFMATRSSRRCRKKKSRGDNEDEDDDDDAV